MRKTMMSFIFMMILATTFAQGDVVKGKFATFGFDMGINRSNLQFNSSTDGDITNGLGYRLGLVGNLQFSRMLSFAPKAELSFNASRISQDDVSMKVSPTNLELMGHLKVRFGKAHVRPYVIAGPNFRVPINGLTSGEYVPTSDDVAIDVGAGIDFGIKKIRISPELRYSFGVKNISRNSTIGDLKYHNIALTLIFSGR